jgi:hypothetical protein
LVPGGKLLDLGINFATYEPFFIPLGAPVFAAAGLASVIDPDAAAWVNGAALVFSDNTRNRDTSSFIYHFQNCTALTTQCSATFSVSKMSAAAPLTHSAASGSIVDGKATFKTINIKESSSHNAKTLVPGGKLLDLSINFATYEPMFIPLGAPVFANIIICTHEPVPCVIGSTLNPTPYFIKNIGIGIK